MILLDIVMPGMDGFEVCRTLKRNERLRTIPVVFLTALKTSRESRIKALEVGAEAFLAKPIDEAELIAQIYAMAKIKAAGESKRLENEQLTALVAGRTRELERELADRRKAEEALRESEERFRAIAEQISDVVFITDTRGVITYLSPAAEKVFGDEMSEMLGVHFADLLPPESVDAALAAFSDGIERGIPTRNLELKMKRKDGTEFFGELTGTLFKVGGFTGAAGAIRDITERKQLEGEAEQARADFLYAVSHELKTPLFLMTAGLELFKGLPPEERQRKYLELEEVWQRNLLRLRFLINNLVDSQRTKTIGLRLSRAPTDLAALVRQAVADLDILVLRQNLHTELDLAPLPLLMLDAEAMERTVHNLLSNAIKFSPPEGEVQVRLGQEEGWILLEVEDHGQGISAEALPHLFQPFARAGATVKAVVPGAGLGLYVSRILVEAHGGAISLESELGKGTTVTVQLPIQAAGS
ncbi:MAG: ATP-binding protein [bacterium]